MFNLNFKNPVVITLFVFILVLTHFSGTITGDEEKVFNFIDSFLRSNQTIITWLTNPLNDCEIWPKCHSSFLKHNFGWFFVNIFFLKISQYLFFFYQDFLSNRILIEICLSFINCLCFWLAFVILFKKYNKENGFALTLATIIIFVYGSYLNNLSAGGYIEAILILILSIRICFLEKKELKTYEIIFVSILDAILISLRFFYFWAVIIFLIINFINLKDKKQIKYILFFLIPIIILSVFYFLQGTITAKAYLNTNELKDINFLEYYFIKITRSFCEVSLIDIAKIYLNRLYLSFFSFSVGIVFIFPVIFLTFNSLKNKVFLFKLLILLGFIFAFSLEQNFYLPAGISGHRGLAPLLIIFFPEVLKGIKYLSLNNKRFIFMIVLSFLIILFTPSLYFRSTLAHYTIFTKNVYKNVETNNENNLVLGLEKNIPRCYKDESFSHSSIQMHPGIFGWKFLISRELKMNETTIDSKNGKKLISLDDFPPQTLFHRINHLIIYNFKNYENNILKKIFNQNTKLILIFKLIYYLSLLLLFACPVILFNYFFKKIR